MSDDRMAYLGLCKCGKWLFVAADVPDCKSVQGAISRKVMRTLRAGGTVTRQSMDETKEMLKASLEKCLCRASTQG